MTSYPLTIDVDEELYQELHDAMEYLQERLIGRVPEVLRRLHTDIIKRLYAGYAEDGTAIELVSDDGTPLSPPPEPTAAELDEYDQEIDAMLAWEASPEGQRELHRQDRFAAFKAEHRFVGEAAMDAWFDEHLETFQRRRAIKRSQIRRDLEAAFTAQDRQP